MPLNQNKNEQKKASIPSCFSHISGRQLGGTVPKKGRWKRGAKIKLHCRTLYINAMSCCVPFTRYPLAIVMPYSRGGRSEAQHNFKISKVLRMGLPIVENLSGPCAIIFSLFKIPRLHLNKKSKKGRIILIFPDSPRHTLWCPVSEMRSPVMYTRSEKSCEGPVAYVETVYLSIRPAEAG